MTFLMPCQFLPCTAIPNYIASLTIGSGLDASTAFNVKAKNLSTGRILHLPTTSTANGEIMLSNVGEDFQLAEAAYQLTIESEDGEVQFFRVGYTDTTGVVVQVERRFDRYGELVEYNQVTLTAI
jgi:hypothetical protein